jgi:predicted RNA-binding Zn-ribbon protein involved in translation (DUF1610 family)
MTGHDSRSVGDHTPLYECTDCGSTTVLPTALDTDGVVPLDCPDCGNDSLTDVDDLCRSGRTIDPQNAACYSEWTERWPDEGKAQLAKGAFRLCAAHYDEKTTFPLPEGAVGRCDYDGCTLAVMERVDGAVLCNKHQ